MKHTRILFVLMAAIAIVLALNPGCGPLSSGGDDSSGVLAPVSSVSGRILRSNVLASHRTATKARISAADLAGFVTVPWAEVWIEDLADDLRYHTISDASGAYLINNVPPGVHNIVSRYLSNGDQLIMKCRSAEFNVTDIRKVFEVPDMDSEVARNIVTCQLRDFEGNFLPENTVLTLWGGTF